jgi:hypothetical protein
LSKAAEDPEFHSQNFGQLVAFHFETFALEFLYFRYHFEILCSNFSPDQTEVCFSGSTFRFALHPCVFGPKVALNRNVDVIGSPDLDYKPDEILAVQLHHHFFGVSLIANSKAILGRQEP